MHFNSACPWTWFVIQARIIVFETNYNVILYNLEVIHCIIPSLGLDIRKGLFHKMYPPKGVASKGAVQSQD